MCFSLDIASRNTLQLEPDALSEPVAFEEQVSLHQAYVKHIAV